MDDKKILKNVSILVAVAMVLSSVGAMAVDDNPSEPVLSLAGTEYTDCILQVHRLDTFDEHWIHFDDGENYQAIGLSAGGTFEGAIRITPDELEGYDGWKLITVRWFHFVASGTNPTHSGNIKIYGDGTSTWPGALITTEPYTVTGTGWKEILLSHPVTLNATKDVWVSIEITHGPGEYPLGIDIRFAVDGKGDWIYYNGVWSELQNISSGPGTLDYNWNIWAKIVGGTDTDPPRTTCILDGEMEGDVYVTDVTVTLEAIDYISGVDYTTYKLDDGEWEIYEDPFVVSDNGDHTVCFYSVDNVGHIEDKQKCTFTIMKLEPDLECDGTLSWTKVKPGATVTGSFTVENVGEPTSELDWKIESYPGWGNWTFTPSSGEDLTPEAGKVTVEVEVVAPDEQNTEFEGEVKVINSDDPSDFCIIPVTLSTPVNQQSSSSQVHQFLQKIIQTYPILEQIFSSSLPYRMLNFQ